MADRETATPTSSTTPAHVAEGPPPEDTVTFTLDGREVTGHKGQMLIAAAEEAGTFIPRFCYHPRMKPVGVCRMCLVEVSGPRGATLQPACFVPVQEGSEVVTTSDKVKKAQDGVLEFLLINHPLDCPVCDKGGECPLQDQTLAHGPGETRFVEEKRHFEKPIPISELVMLDRERCIQCSRCTRFADEVAGEAQIDFIGRGEQLEVNVFPELPFTSYFSGNTVQICPVGALTASPYRFTARPWDLEQVESTCTTCSVGCRVTVQSSANRVTRLLGIDSDPVNHGWLCDKGRFAFESVNSDDRLTEPLVRKGDRLVPASWHEALDAVSTGLRAASAAGGSGVGVIGGARLTNEGAYTWAKLAKGVLGTDSVDAQLGDGLPAEVVLGLPRATIDQTASADTVIVLSGDVREELPVLFLRLREGIVDGNLSLVELAPHATSLTSYAAASLRYVPGEATQLARAVADPASSAPEGVDTEALAEARRMAAAGKVVVVVGRPSLAEDGALVAEAAQALAAALPGATFLPALRRGNVMGALDMGLAPGVLPGRVTLDAGRSWFTEAWGSVPGARGRDTAEMLSSAAGRPTAGGDRIKALVLLGADPLGDFPDRRLVRQALDAADFVVAVASAPTAVTELADVVLPAAEAHERPGTTTNVEGRVSRLGQKLVAPGQAWPDWMIAAELAVHLDTDFLFGSVADVWDEIERLAPAYRGITSSVLDAPGAADGVVAPLVGTPVSLGRRQGGRPLDPIAFPGVESVERQGAPFWAGLAEPRTADLGAGAEGAAAIETGDVAAARPAVVRGPVDLAVPHVAPTDSYSHRLVASRRLYDQGTAVGAAPALAALVPSAAVRVNPHDLDDLGIASGGLVRVRTASASAVVAAVPDPSLPRRSVATDFNVPLAGDGLGGRARGLAERCQHRRRPHRRRLPRDRAPSGDAVNALTSLVQPLLGSDDPLYAHGVNWIVFLIVVLKVLIVFGALMFAVMMMIWFERKVISDMQSRIGPNRAGPFGIMQTLADGIKLFFKEDLIPGQSDRAVFKLAPYLAIIPAFLAFSIVPIGGEATIAGRTFEIQLADPPMGILFLLAMSSIAVYGVMLAGWSSGSKYPLLGSVRASAQMISYEAALGMTVVTVVLITGSLSTRSIVVAQAQHLWQWNAFRLGVVPFVIFFIAIIAETNRPPFDLVEAESELVGGFHTEYSSIRFALFYLAEFMNTITMSAITVTLFFGGPDGPIPHTPYVYWIWPIIWFLLKTTVFLFIFVWLRAALPRLRYDQLMDLGWKKLIPLSLGWLLIVAGFVVDGWWGVGLAVALVVGGGLMYRAFAIGAEREETRAILPEVGLRLWSRPEQPPAQPVAPPGVGSSLEGGDA